MPSDPLDSSARREPIKQKLTGHFTLRGQKIWLFLKGEKVSLIVKEEKKKTLCSWQVVVNI